ncbi:MAG: hypothetical protein GY808_01720 [Gammaproteobacteria bacterium]|nr:hypothetical protein [Gammaproteobacteria bacterium]
MKFKLFNLIFMISFITGCAMPPPIDPTVSDLKGIRIYSTNADQQSTIMKDHNSTERFCLARGADVADTESDGIGASFGVGSKNESLSDGSSRGAVDLGGRNPAVLITRELMYRTCEMMMNLNLTKEESLKLFAKTLNASISISQSQTDSGVAALSGNALLEGNSENQKSDDDDDDNDDDN